MNKLQSFLCRLLMCAIVMVMAQWSIKPIYHSIFMTKTCDSLLQNKLTISIPTTQHTVLQQFTNTLRHRITTTSWRLSQLCFPCICWTRTLWCFWTLIILSFSLLKNNFDRQHPWRHLDTLWLLVIIYTIFFIHKEANSPFMALSSSLVDTKSHSSAFVVMDLELPWDLLPVEVARIRSKKSIWTTIRKGSLSIWIACIQASADNLNFLQSINLQNLLRIWFLEPNQQHDSQ